MYFLGFESLDLNEVQCLGHVLNSSTLMKIIMVSFCLIKVLINLYGHCGLCSTCLCFNIMQNITNYSLQREDTVELN